MDNFDLKELQETVLGVPSDIILPEDYVDQVRDQRERVTRRIVDLYSSCRKNSRVFSSTYNALSDNNSYVRVAAADIIGEKGNLNSFDYLFKALEDEEEVHVRQSIVTAIDKLEGKLTKPQDDSDKTTLMESMRILSFKP